MIHKYWIMFIINIMYNNNTLFMVYVHTLLPGYDILEGIH